MTDNFARLKWRWVDTIMHDGDLTPTERLVGYEIAAHLNQRSGDAWPSQKTIARNLGIDLKSVKRAVAALAGYPKKKFGPRRTQYLQIVWDKTTRANSYIPCFSPVAAPRGQIVPNEGDKNGPTQGDNFSSEGDITPPNDGDKNGLQSTLTDPLYEEVPFPQTGTCSPSEAAWLSVKNRLRINLTPSIVKAWFDPMEMVAISGNVVVLRVSGPFVRSQLHTQNNNLFDHLTDAWRAELPTIERVRLVDPAARAAE